MTLQHLSWCNYLAWPVLSLPFLPYSDISLHDLSLHVLNFETFQAKMSKNRHIDQNNKKVRKLLQKSYSWQKAQDLHSKFYCLSSNLLGISVPRCRNNFHLSHKLSISPLASYILTSIGSMQVCVSSGPFIKIEHFEQFCQAQPKPQLPAPAGLSSIILIQPAICPIRQPSRKV